MKDSNKSEKKPEFLVDSMLRGLSRWLRFLGYHARDIEKVHDLESIIRENPAIIFITCSRKHGETLLPDQYLLIREEDPAKQLQQIDKALDIFKRIELLSICSICNVEIEPIRKDKIIDGVPDEILKKTDQFWRCPSCRRFYWRGGHITRLLDKLKSMNVPILDSTIKNS